MNRSPRTLEQARVQLHWASQIISATADALLERAADDSQSSMQWDPQTLSLIGPDLRGLGCLRLEIPTPGLVWKDRELALSGQTVEAIFSWVHAVIPGLTSTHRARLRGYDMPAHAFASGAPFDASDTEAFHTLTHWCDLGWSAVTSVHASLPHASPLLWWPHHFDAGSVIAMNSDHQRDKRSIGFGFSLGDDGFNQPYFYVNPYGLKGAAQNPPPLSIGHWEQYAFQGYAATATVLSQNPNQLAPDFLQQAIRACQNMLE